MESVFGKTCYFFIKDRCYKGKILKHKKSKYIIELSKGQGYYDITGNTNIIYVDKNEVLFSNQMDLIIEKHSNDMLVDVITGEFVIRKYEAIFRSLNNFFPSNKHVIECFSHITKIISKNAYF